jgi:ADP-ribose pyrophosphatase
MDSLGDFPLDLPLRGERLVYRGKAFDFRSDDVELGNGVVVTRDYLAHPGAVGIIAVNEKNELLLQSQYRHPVRSTLWEPPAGLLDLPDEAPLAAAKRELFEEADLQAADWRQLIDFYTSPGGSSESIRVFLARGLSEVPASERFVREDEEAMMKPAWVDLDEAARLIFAGKLHSPTAVNGIFAALRARDAIGWDKLPLA